MPTRTFCAVIYVLLCCSAGGLAVKSTYVCEGRTQDLKCPSHTVLLIYKALFGRVEPGSKICPHPNINSTSCAAKNSTKIASKICNYKSKCSISADPSTFGGDPCPGNFKYLDVIYDCVSAPVRLKTTVTTLPSFTPQIRTTNTTITPNVTSGPASTENKKNPSYPTVISTSPTTSVPQGAPNLGFSGPGGEQSITVSLLVSFVLCYKVIQEKPRYTIVIFLSVVAAVTITLLFVLTAVHICKRQNERRKFKVEMQELEKDSESPQPKTVTIEIQGSREDTREIHVSPGDIIIIDHNELNSAGSEDLGYLSEIVRYYNGHSTTGSDDQSSLRKRSLTCGSPSVISTETSEIDKKADVKTDRPEVNGDCVTSPIDITVNPLCVS